MNVRVVDVASILTMVLAVLLIGLAIMFQYTYLPVAFWSDIVVGLVLFVLALGRNRGWGSWPSYINLLLGLYLLILPYGAGFFTYGAAIGTVVASVANVAFGLGIAILSAWDLFSVFSKPQAEVATFSSAEPPERD